MLIYEKKVDGVTHLFGTFGNVPADTDVQLTYKGADGQLIADIRALKFFYQRGIALLGGKSVRQVPAEDDIKVNVYLGEELIVGEKAEDATNVVEDEPAGQAETLDVPVVEETVAEKTTRKTRKAVEQTEEVSE